MIAGDVEGSQHKMKARLDNLGLRAGARVRWQLRVAWTSGECPDLARVDPQHVRNTSACIAMPPICCGHIDRSSERRTRLLGQEAHA